MQLIGLRRRRKINFLKKEKIAFVILREIKTNRLCPATLFFLLPASDASADRGMFSGYLVVSNAY